MITCEVLCTSGNSLWKFLEKSFPGQVNAEKLYTWMQACSRLEMKEYLSEGNTMFYATVGVNDLVFMPPGFVFVEKVAASSDSFGARLAVLSTLASHVKQLSDFHMLLLNSKSSNETLSRVVDGLVLKSLH